MKVRSLIILWIFEVSLLSCVLFGVRGHYHLRMRDTIDYIYNRHEKELQRMRDTIDYMNNRHEKEVQKMQERARPPKP